MENVVKELIQSIENEHAIQIVSKKHDFDYDTLFPIPSPPSESSFEINYMNHQILQKDQN